MDPESPTHSAAVAEDSESRVIPLHPEYANGDEPPSVSLRIRKLRVFALLAGLGLLAIVSTVFGMMMAVASDLPELEEPSATNSVIVDRRGEPLGRLTGNQKRILLKESQIAPVMKHAIIAIEDKRFYTNDGVDLRGIGRALYEDVVAKRAVQGGSTIAQQFVKNALAAQDQRTLFVKLREAALAYHITRKWSKQKILRNYLNSIYFGNGAYGIESAARTYFGSQHPGCDTDRARPCAAQLEPQEAALIAGVVASPSAFDPIAHPVAAKKRRDEVLARMLEQQLISREQYDAAIAEPIPLRREIQPPREETKYPYFTSWIKQQVVDQLGGGQTGARQAFEGGLTIQTTIDGRFQKAADDAIRAWLPYTGGPRASLVAIDNKTGEVRAMVGGDDYNSSPFNLATQGQRQPGSAFKPFVLAEALKKGISPTSVWASRKKVFDVPHSSEKFTVENYSDAYAGATTLANATVTSDNSVYAEVGIKTGTKKIARLARRMGIRTPVSHNWAMTLGGLKQGVTPLDMAHAYQTFARKGKLVYGTLSPGRLGRKRPVPGPVGIRAIRRKDDGKLKAIELPERRAGAQQGRDAPRARRERGQHRRHDPPGRREERHRQARAARSAHPGGRQDRHDGELRRRLVRRLHARVHGRGVGRLPQEVPADEDRVPGPAGGRRHVPGRHLEDVHAVRAQDRPAAGAQGQGPGDGHPGRDRRAGRRGHGRARPPRRRRRPRPRRPRAAAPTAGRPHRSSRENPTPKQPTNPQPAEPAPTAPPSNSGGTQPSGGTGAAPPTGQG